MLKLARINVCGLKPKNLEIKKTELGDQIITQRQEISRIRLGVIFTALRVEGFWDFPGGAVVKNPPANAKDTGSIPGLGRSHMLRSN